ncbi:MAG: hypothetical protein IT337_10615 [Thermomicrobiales bacterium]|nr:hypothetical protein [Thermomicrobiales bacterium]
MQVGVELPDGSVEAVVLGYSGDMDGLFKGTDVRVFGRVVDTATIILEVSGGVAAQPVISVDRLEIM